MLPPSAADGMQMPHSENADDRLICKCMRMVLTCLPSDLPINGI